MTDFGEYQHAKDQVEAAKLDCERASLKLSLKQIQCRLAEIRSQHEPLDTIWPCDSGDNRDARERTYNAAFYVVVGRLPETEKVEEME